MHSTKTLFKHELHRKAYYGFLQTITVLKVDKLVPCTVYAVRNKDIIIKYIELPCMLLSCIIQHNNRYLKIFIYIKLI